jgi:hypothetical protein
MKQHNHQKAADDSVAFYYSGHARNIFHQVQTPPEPEYPQSGHTRFRKLS